MSRLKYVRHCLCNALYVYCRGRAVTNVGKTCGPTPCFVLAINTFKLKSDHRVHICSHKNLSTVVLIHLIHDYLTCINIFGTNTYNTLNQLLKMTDSTGLGQNTGTWEG